MHGIDPEGIVKLLAHITLQHLWRSVDYYTKVYAEHAGEV